MTRAVDPGMVSQGKLVIRERPDKCGSFDPYDKENEGICFPTQIGKTGASPWSQALGGEVEHEHLVAGSTPMGLD